MSTRSRPVSSLGFFASRGHGFAFWPAGWEPSGKLVEKTIHIFGGDHRRDALGQFRGGNQARRIFLKELLADTVFEERTKGRKFARDGAFLEAVVVEVGDEFADHSVLNFRESGRRRFGWRKEKGKLI